MQPLEFGGESVWDADALARLIPNDAETMMALPNEVFVEHRFQPGVFLRSRQHIIEVLSEEELTNDETDEVDEAPNEQDQNFAGYVKKRYPKIKRTRTNNI
jgi:hypothetical protein